ncbi:MAG: Ppx/GppA family phosphatase [Thermoanaerobaculia bacterium]|nr:MAG: Ppx/GppA family phosphatase [Thermoanaerobaculia bacterium]
MARMAARRTPEPAPAAATPPPGASTARVAAIDIGSNSIHMIVAEGDGDGGFRVLTRERDMVRLGRSALSRGALSRRAVRDGLEALLRMTTLARLKGAGRIDAVATSAVREAANGQEFLDQVRALTGLEVRALDGREEGELVFRAVRAAVDLGPRGTLLVDVGGGSTEWCVARAGELARVRSLPLGSLRCAGWLAGDPPSARSIEKLRRDIRSHLGGARPPARLGMMIATSGTAACCGDLADHFAGRGRALSTGGLRALDLRELGEVIARLRALTRREIAELPPVDRPRAESILAGAILLEELARRAGATSLHLSDRALREGMVLAALGAPAAGPRTAGSARRRQVLELAGRAPAMLDHGTQVARLAVRLFDLTAPLHNLGSREREWLENAALLHDVGYSIHFRRHHKHSQYLIASAPLDAFDAREIDILAHVARYHRGAPPRQRHASFAALEPWQQKVIRKLAALLRIGNALDRTHAARVVELHGALSGRRRMVIEVLSPWDVALELAAARHRSGLFEELFGRRIEFRAGLEPARHG